MVRSMLSTDEASRPITYYYLSPIITAKVEQQSWRNTRPRLCGVTQNASSCHVPLPFPHATSTSVHRFHFRAPLPLPCAASTSTSTRRFHFHTPLPLPRAASISTCRVHFHAPLPILCAASTSTRHFHFHAPLLHAASAYNYAMLAIGIFN